MRWVAEDKVLVWGHRAQGARRPAGLAWDGMWSPQCGVAAATISLAAIATAWASIGLALETSAAHPVRAPARSPAAFNLRYSDVHLKTEDGVALAAWWVPASRSATVVLVHGYGGSRGDMLGHAAYLNAARYSVLLIDLRAHGASGGRHSTLGYLEWRDVESAVDWVATTHPGPVILFGASLGAVAGIEAAVRDPRVRGVIDDGGYGDLAALLKSPDHRIGRIPTRLFEPGIALMARIEAGFDVDQVHPARSARKLAVPLLVLVGDLDPSQSNQLTVYTSAPGPKQLVRFHTSNHLQGAQLEPDRYRRAVLSFVGAIAM